MTVITCLICKKRPADKKGSHIVPVSLLATMVNYDNSIKRANKEITFSISSTGYSKVFIGREVPLEEINKTFGQEISEKNLKNNNDPLIRDNIFCSKCEANLGEVEGTFSKLFLNDYKNGKFKGKDLNETIIHNLTIPSSLFFAYFLSISVRASLVRINDFKMPDRIESNICRMFVSLFETDIKNWNSTQNEIIKEHYKGKMVIISNHNYNLGNNSVLINPFLINPYLLCLNSFIVIFTDNLKTQLNSSTNNFFGLSQYVNPDTINLATNESTNIVILEEKKWEDYRIQTINFIKDIFVKNLIRLITNLYFKLVCRKPNQNDIDEILNQIVNEEEVELGFKYSIDRISGIISKYFNRFLGFKDN